MRERGGEGEKGESKKQIKKAFMGVGFVPLKVAFSINAEDSIVANGINSRLPEYSKKL